MSVNLTRPVATVISDNSPVDKGPMRDLLSDLITAINGIDPLLTPSYPSRASAIASAQALPSSVNMILVWTGSTFELRTRGAQANDPLFDTAPRWGLALRLDNAGRVWHTTGSNLATLTPPDGTQQIIQVIGGGLITWRTQSAPSTPNPAIDIQTADQRWWRLSEDTSAIKLMINDMVARDTPSYLTRSAALAGVQNLPTPVTQILVQEGDSLVLRSRTATMDPLQSTGSPWGVSYRGVTALDLSTLRTDGLIADTQMGSATLGNVAGTGNAITAEVPGLLRNVGIVASNLRGIDWLPVANNAAGGVTINIDGTGPVEIRGLDDQPLPANSLRTGVLAAAVKVGSRWRISTPEQTRANVLAEIEAAAVLLRGLIDQANTLRASGDSDLGLRLLAEVEARREGDAPTRGGRGDGALPAVTVNDVVVLGVDPQTGRILLRLTMPSMQDIAATLPAADVRAMVDRSAYQPLPTQMAVGRESRQPFQAAVQINGVPVMLAFSDGKMRLAPDDWTIGYIAERLNLDGAAISTAPLVPSIPGVDAWDQWRSGDLDIFTAQIYGPVPRQYMRLGSGVPWLMAPERVRVRLLYGDGLANASTDRSAERFERIATLKDGRGDAGWNGALPSVPATDLERVGATYVALTADRWLATKTGQQLLVGVRSEAVEGATLNALAGGQPMANLARAVTQFRTVAARYGRTTQVDVVSILWNGTDATIGTRMLALVQAVLAQTGALSVNVFGPAGTWQDDDAATVLGMTQMIQNRGTVPVVYVSPLYWCDVRSGSLAMPTPECMTMLAELEAHAAIVGSGWMPPIAFGASRSGTTINVDFDVMSDTILAAPSIEGLHYSGGNVVSATVVPNPTSGRQTRLAITVSAAAGGTLSYAVGRTGTDQSRFANRGQLRDNWSAPSATGRVLRRHALPFRFEVS